MALTVVQPGVGGTGNANLTFPNVTGTVMVSGNMPAFLANTSTTSSISSGVVTIMPLNTAVYDTASCFNTSTYRFTPNVAGYYWLCGSVAIYGFAASGGSTQVTARLYKNGSAFVVGNFLPVQSNSSEPIAYVSCLVYANGTTDYFSLYGSHNSGSNATIDSGAYTYFSGFLARTA